MNRLPVIWSDNAWRDLESIFDFIARHSRIQAQKQIFRIIERGEQLSVNPMSGPIEQTVDPKLQARYLVQDNYKIFYSVNGETVLIDTVFDTRQDPVKLKL